ncbi:exoribonuclease 2 [Cellvibrio zantedeschiae]|uniref:exoribonuclease II n=1 Tax=Cellvibrio zantedeschiae TaxID=1237077 RepID=A0ABQ3ATA5_9GAMM|nr:VacB/RNase II family 3'-5' exoribonuclease [Cellvibrio zantedeschiae]GGY67095.1 exoribonuclease 2 [Cellvibrio zantedeschiae]
MLNNSALQQLAQLKTTLVAQKDIAQGSVRSTTKRFGFVILDDGREAFLDPEQMLRVLPDDRVQVEVTTNSKDQLEAKLEKLISSPFKEFVGRYVSKGNNFFVEPDVNNFNRWLFVPPQDRKGLNVDDLVRCTITRHPFNDGKAQVKIIGRLGTADEPGIENRYTVAKFQLPNEWIVPAQNHASSINWSPLVFENGELDLTHLPFVTIDAENTRDMDDAIYIKATENGWELITAIADPSKQIDIGSPLELAARERASTVYLLGQSITMLPPELSHDTYSLVPEKKRPALICKIQIAKNGEITHYEFAEAQIRSQHKLSYQAVADHLNNVKSLADAGYNVSDDINNMLTVIQEFAQVRADYRLEHALVMDEKADYFFILNDQKKIDHVDKRERNVAHRMIEEAMLATNICAGELFVKNPGYGIFSTHVGFRPERLNDAISLITEDRPDLIEAGLTATGLTKLDKFQKLIKELRVNPNNNPKNGPLLSLLQRMLQAGSLSFEHIPHFGLGFNAYAMVTSPIRRYNDFYNHLAIKRILRGEPAIEINTQELSTQLQEQLNSSRQACRYLELWLQSQFMLQHIDTLHTGTIALVNSNGIGVRLDDLGIEGYALLAPRDGEVKAQFDSRRLSLTIEGKTYRLDEKVHVLVKEVDVAKRKIAFEVVDQATADRLSAWL